jgi:hypothetical protein
MKYYVVLWEDGLGFQDHKLVGGMKAACALRDEKKEEGYDSWLQDTVKCGACFTDYPNEAEATLCMCHDDY